MERQKAGQQRQEVPNAEKPQGSGRLNSLPRVPEREHSWGEQQLNQSPRPKAQER